VQRTGYRAGAISGDLPAPALSGRATRYTALVKLAPFLPAVSGALLLASAAAAPPPAVITIDYPAGGSIFPPRFPAPAFLWRDTRSGATEWTIDIQLAGRAAIHIRARGEKPRIGEIDPRAVADTNALPALDPRQAAAREWRPDSTVWKTIQEASVAGPAVITFTGYHGSVSVSRGRVRIRTSRDAVGAPIFYRDVPLMPSETEKGVIKPLANTAIPLIAWRLCDVTQNSSRILMEGLHTCANCHSFSADGKTMGMDVDGPQNDKGLYAIVPVQPRMSIGGDNVVAWSTFRGKLGGRLRVGFMSQVAPDGRYVVTTINDPGMDETEYERRKNLREVALNYYVANFKDYRFLQVFYPTRGILAWYNRAAGVLQPLPGADDPRYVHTNAVWSPDGSYLVFARAEACDPYPPGAPIAVRANDPAETRIRYDLYRIPFRGGQGGRPEPIAGASANGMSNSFPKVSPDGRWIVFVQSRNGQLMRPDSQLYIVPSGGGAARRMRCNTSLMNSWHSFSPNGRWLVFSSKSRSPYTQMFLTHIDDDGSDSPAILIENATAANRAVNIPEFVNIPPDGMLEIAAPVTGYYTLVDSATDLMKKGMYRDAAAEWAKALQLGPGEARAHNNLGVCLFKTGRIDEAMAHYNTALELSPEYPEALNNLGDALVRRKQFHEAIPYLEKAIALNPRYASAHSNLGAALAQLNRIDEAISHLEKAVEYQPDLADARNNLGVTLAIAGRYAEAIAALKVAVELTGGDDPMMLELLARMYARTDRFESAAAAARRALATASRRNNARLIEMLKARIAEYESRIPPRR
jgi:Flp pilus assembly protein TadD